MCWKSKLSNQADSIAIDVKSEVGVSPWQIKNLIRVMQTCRPSNKKIRIVLSYVLLLLGSSLIPMDRDIQGLQFIIDLKPAIQNLLHIPMYIVLAILFLQILQNYQIEGWKAYILVFLSSGFFGIINEIIQIVIPGRYGGLMDIYLNLVGAIIGIIIYMIVAKFRPSLIRRIVCE